MKHTIWCLISCASFIAFFSIPAAATPLGKGPISDFFISLRKQRVALSENKRKLGSFKSNERHGTDLSSLLKERAIDNSVFVTTSTCGYADFTVNWVLHMQEANVTNYIVIAEDARALEYLVGKFDGHVISSASFHRPFYSKGGIDLVEYNNTGLSWCSRPHYLKSIAERGYTAIWVDSDVALLRNPMPLLPRSYDIITANDELIVDDDRRYHNICSCFVAARPQLGSFELLRSWAAECGDQTQNQPSLSAVMREHRGKINAYVMPRSVLPCGKLMENIELESITHALRPYWVHANYRVGREKKLLFLKKHGAWKVPETEVSCALK